MRRGAVQWEIGAGAVLPAAVLYFFDGAWLLLALLSAVLIHELGHWAALRLGGARLTRVRAGLFGLEMDYTGTLNRRAAFLSLAAGPLAGLLYAGAAVSAGGSFGWRSGILSLGLSCFNLLPVLPLDGGRMAAELLGGTAARRLSRLLAAALLLSGGILLPLYHTPSLLAMGCWLCLSNSRLS